MPFRKHKIDMDIPKSAAFSHERNDVSEPEIGLNIPRIFFSFGFDGLFRLRLFLRRRDGRRSGRRDGHRSRRCRNSFRKLRLRCGHRFLNGYGLLCGRGFGGRNRLLNGNGFPCGHCFCFRRFFHLNRSLGFRRFFHLNRSLGFRFVLHRNRRRGHDCRILFRADTASDGRRIRPGRIHLRLRFRWRDRGSGHIFWGHFNGRFLRRAALISAESATVAAAATVAVPGGDFNKFGFRLGVGGLRLYGLILTLTSVVLLVFVGSYGADPLTRFVVFVLGGAICFAISALYSRACKRVEL